MTTTTTTLIDHVAACGLNRVATSREYKDTESHTRPRRHNPMSRPVRTARGDTRAELGMQRPGRRPNSRGQRYLYRCAGEDWRGLLGQYWLYRRQGYSQIGAARRAVQSGKYERGYGQSDITVVDITDAWTLTVDYDAATQRIHLTQATDAAADRAAMCRKILGTELWNAIAAGHTRQAAADLTGQSLRSVERLIAECREQADAT